MKKNKGIWVIVGCLILVFILLNTFSVFSKKDTASTDTATATTTTDTLIEVTFASSTKTVQTKEYGFQFDFPVTNVDAINTEINAFVDETVSAFEDEVKSFGPLPVVDRQYTMYGWFQPHIEGNYATFAFLVSVDTGGAHPNQLFYTKTFRPTGELVSVETVIKELYGDTVTLDQIAQVTSTILTAQLGDDAAFGWIEDGLKPAPENFADFYVEQNELVLLFEPYAIGPYAWGSVMVRIPRDAFIAPESSATSTPTSTPVMETPATTTVDTTAVTS
jgi:hypothetical protein